MNGGNTCLKALLIFLSLVSCPAAAQELKWRGPYTVNRTTEEKATSRTARIQPGDPLVSFLNRHGVTRDELKLLNPGVQLSALTVGMELQLPIDPDGNLSPQEQRVLDRLNLNEDKKEEQRRRAFESDYKRWGKCYGIYRYDWLGWKKSPNGTWTTDVTTCLPPLNPEQPREPFEAISVTCEGLKVSRLSTTSVILDDGWTEWKDPGYGEREMIVKLCSREER